MVIKRRFVNAGEIEPILKKSRCKKERKFEIKILRLI